MSLSLLRSYPETDFSTLDQYLMSKVYAVPPLLKTKALQHTLDDFCRDTKFWQEDLILYPTVGFNEYPIPEIGNSRFVELVSARYEDGTMLELGRDCWMVGNDQLRVSDRILSEAKPIVIRAALTPAIDATTANQSLIDYCAEAVADGAASRLFLMPGQPWTDYEQGARYRDRYMAGKRQARRLMLNNFTDYHNPVRKRNFY